MTRSNNLEGLSLETLSSEVLEFEGKARANQLEHLSCASFLCKLLVLPENFRLDWKVIARYKQSSLFGLVIRNEGKKFYNIDTSSTLSGVERYRWASKRLSSPASCVDVIKRFSDQGDQIGQFFTN